MEGTVSRIHPHGYFFIETKRSPIGCVDQYFGLISKIVSGSEYLTVGSIVSFEVSREPRHGRLPAAADITVHPASDITELTGAAKVGA